MALWATDTSDVNKTFLSRPRPRSKYYFKTKTMTKTFSFKTKTKTKTLPGPLNRLPNHGHKMSKTVYTRHA